MKVSIYIYGSIQIISTYFHSVSYTSLFIVKNTNQLTYFIGFSRGLLWKLVFLFTFFYVNNVYVIILSFLLGSVYSYVFWLMINNSSTEHDLLLAVLHDIHAFYHILFCKKYIAHYSRWTLHLVFQWLFPYSHFSVEHLNIPGKLCSEHLIIHAVQMTLWVSTLTTCDAVPLQTRLSLTIFWLNTLTVHLVHQLLDTISVVLTW